jgi:multisubunit Na+/H+ antiporter MnhC subunit
VTETSGLSPRRVIVAALIGLGSHALVAIAAYVAGRVTRPSPGGGFEDLAALASVLLLGEIVVGLGCLAAGVVWFVKGRREVGLGLVGGWLVGILAGCILLQF